jgi:hypothetical protein
MHVWDYVLLTERADIDVDFDGNHCWQWISAQYAILHELECLRH